MADQKIVGDPAPPPDSERPPLQEIWMSPTSTLSLAALRGLWESFDIDVVNLTDLRSRLCDGKPHLLAKGLHPVRAEQLEETLRSLNIGFEVREERSCSIS